MTEASDDRLSVMRAEFSARMAAVEDCLGRLTTAVERLSDNRERILVLETRFEVELSHIRSEQAAIRKLLEDGAKADSERDRSLTRLQLIAGAALFVAGAVMASLLKKILPGAF
ncbi:hypothetical protein [Inquilinus sp. OTU3971]|uniref:hypothetical protein n=1 Tax=Inquilinus sp. OTU3971 TaxID=3043855 RepID=UPI00313B4CAA